MSIWLVKHPRVLVDHTKCYGRSERALTDTFKEEVEAIKTKLPWIPDVVWTSPALRCQRTAVALGGVVKVDERLEELNYGDWEGLSWKAINRTECEKWQEDPWTRRPPHGESGEDLEQRVEKVRNEILRTVGQRKVVIVTHDGVLRVWRRLVEKKDRAAAVEWRMPCGTVREMD